MIASLDGHGFFPPEGSTKFVHSDFFDWIAQKAKNKFQRQKEEVQWKQFCAMKLKWTEKQHMNENGQVTNTTKEKKAVFSVGNYQSGVNDKDAVRERHSNLEENPAFQIFLKELILIRKSLQKLELQCSPSVQQHSESSRHKGYSHSPGGPEHKKNRKSGVKNEIQTRTKGTTEPSVKAKKDQCRLLTPKFQGRQELLQQRLKQLLINKGLAETFKSSEQKSKRYYLERQTLLKKVLSRLEQIEAEQEAVQENWSTLLNDVEPVELDRCIPKYEAEKMIETMQPLAEKTTLNTREKMPIIELGLSSDVLSSIQTNKEQFEEYLRRIDHFPGKNFDPWLVVQSVADELLDKVLQTVASELEDIPDQCVERLINEELN